MTLKVFIHEYFYMVSDFDRELLGLLAADGRRSLKSLAKQLKVSITTVKNHIDALQEKGVIERFTMETNIEELGYTVKSVIAARFKRGTLVEAQRRICAHPNVAAVYDVTGRYDALIVCRFKETTDLDEFIKNVLPTDYVTETETFVALNTFKEDFLSLPG